MLYIHYSFTFNVCFHAIHCRCHRQSEESYLQTMINATIFHLSKFNEAQHGWLWNLHYLICKSHIMDMGDAAWVIVNLVEKSGLLKLCPIFCDLWIIQIMLAISLFCQYLCSGSQYGYWMAPPNNNIDKIGRSQTCGLDSSVRSAAKHKSIMSCRLHIQMLLYLICLRSNTDD